MTPPSRLDSNPTGRSWDGQKLAGQARFMTQMTFPVAFPTIRGAAITAPAGQPRLLLRGAEFAAALAVHLGTGPTAVPARADRGVIAAGPRVPATAARSWIASWKMSQLPHRGRPGR
jgi:hypothetical protein